MRGLGGASARPRRGMHRRCAAWRRRAAAVFQIEIIVLEFSKNCIFFHPASDSYEISEESMELIDFEQFPGIL